MNAIKNYISEFSSEKYSNWYFYSYKSLAMLIVMFLILLYRNYLLSALFVLLFVLINTVVSIVYIALSAARKTKNRTLKLVTHTIFAVIFQLLAIVLVFPNRWVIDFVCISKIVRIVEPILMQKLDSLNSPVFKFHKFYFGQVMGRVRWVIYDESEQILLVPEKRSQEWWLTTGEDKYYDNDCLDAARKIHSHFFIRYSFCI